MRKLNCAPFVLVMLCCSWSWAQKPAAMVIRVYRVTDMVMPQNNYPFQGNALPTTMEHGAGAGSVMMGGFGGGSGGMGGGGMGGGGMGGGGFFSVPSQVGGKAGSGKTVQQQQVVRPKTPVRPGAEGLRFNVDELIEAIKATIEPDTWDVLGGMGTCRRLGGMLLIKQSSEVHKQIDELLEQIQDRGGSLQTITVKGYWMSLDGRELTQLVDRKQSSSALDRTELEKAISSKNPMRCWINCFSGQTVHVVSGDRPNIVTGSVPVVGDAIAYMPQMSVPNIGALLQITPRLSADGRSAIVDVQSSVTAWDKSQLTVSPLIAVDRVNLKAQQLATSMRLPLETPILVGGLSGRAEQSTGVGARADGGRASSDQVYLILELSASK